MAFDCTRYLPKRFIPHVVYVYHNDEYVIQFDDDVNELEISGATIKELKEEIKRLRLKNENN